jgi:hypothetical protein
MSRKWNRVVLWSFVGLFSLVMTADVEAQIFRRRRNRIRGNANVNYNYGYRTGAYSGGTYGTYGGAGVMTPGVTAPGVITGGTSGGAVINPGVGAAVNDGARAGVRGGATVDGTNLGTGARVGAGTTIPGAGTDVRVRGQTPDGAGALTPPPSLPAPAIPGTPATPAPPPLP